MAKKTSQKDKKASRKGKSQNPIAQKDPNKHSAFSLAEKLKERKRLNRKVLNSI